MNYSIDPELKTPAYLQLYQHFVRDITAGVYAYGTRLPSKRTIAAETGVSIITVEHAIGLLCEEGYAESRQRSGCFVIYRKDDFPGEGTMNLQGKTVVQQPQQHAGEFPYSVLARTIRRVLLDYGELILDKSPNRGCNELRNEISRYIGRSRGILVSPEQIIIGSGAEYLYGLLVQLLGRDKIYGLENPSYEKIRKVYNAMGVACEMLTLNADGITSRDLEETGAQILHVTPFNSYPSGITASISKKHEYLRWAGNRGGIIIEDNYDSELTVSRKAEEPLFAMAEEENVIYINTFSKTIAPSIRIGYMILPKQMLGTFREKLGFYSCTVPLLDQYVLAELLRSGDFERHINRIRRRRRRES